MVSKNVVHLHNGILFSTKIMKFAGKLIELVNILREATQSQKDKSFNVISHMGIFTFKF